ncbi:MAG: hypothetical protein AAFN79_19100 [Pseudomonadota bacterium]
MSENAPLDVAAKAAASSLRVCALAAAGAVVMGVGAAVLGVGLWLHLADHFGAADASILFGLGLAAIGATIFALRKIPARRRKSQPTSQPPKPDIWVTLAHAFQGGLQVGRSIRRN